MDLDNSKISARAYQLFLERFGGQAPLDDWLKAEMEVKNSHEDEDEQKSTLKQNNSFSLQN